MLIFLIVIFNINVSIKHFEINIFYAEYTPFLYSALSDSRPVILNHVFTKYLKFDFGVAFVPKNIKYSNQTTSLLFSALLIAVKISHHRKDEHFAEQSTFIFETARDYGANYIH